MGRTATAVQVASVLFIARQILHCLYKNLTVGFQFWGSWRANWFGHEMGELINTENCLLACLLTIHSGLRIAQDTNSLSELLLIYWRYIVTVFAISLHFLHLLVKESFIPGGGAPWHGPICTQFMWLLMHWHTYKSLLNSLGRAVEQLAGCLAKAVEGKQPTPARSVKMCYEYLIRWRNRFKPGELIESIPASTLQRILCLERSSFFYLSAIDLYSKNST